MSIEDDINWVTVTLEFPPEDDAMLEGLAQAEGMSFKCFCIHKIFELVLSEASADEAERWRAQLPLTLIRNECQ